MKQSTSVAPLLRPLQRGAVDFVCARQSAGLLFQQRLGKTWITCGVLERKRPELTLIVSELANIETTWVVALERFVPYLPLTYAKAQGSKKKQKLLAALKAFQSGVFLIHREGFCSIIKQIRRKKWSFVVIDEADKAKARATLFSRSLAKLRHIEKKLILTGTPIESDPQDLWAQMRFLAPDVFGTRWKDFDEEYMEQPKIDLDAIDPRTGKPKYPKGSMRWKRALRMRRIMQRKLKFRSDMLPQFMSKVKDYLWRAELETPPPNFHIEYVRLRGEQRELYDQMDKTQVIRVDGVRIMAGFKVTKNEKLHQICGGTLLDEDGEVHRVGRAKLRRLLSIIKRRGAPAVIFCRYRDEIELVLEELPRDARVGVLGGKEKDRDVRARTQRDFQSGRLDYIVCQTRTGGRGVDLYKAKYLIVYSTTYSSIDFDQLISRIRLPEQTEPVDIFLIVAQDTIDEDKFRMIQSKLTRVGAALSHLKRGGHDGQERSGSKRVQVRRGGLRKGSGRHTGQRSRDAA